jgi:hypothetical protein
MPAASHGAGRRPRAGALARLLAGALLLHPGPASAQVWLEVEEPADGSEVLVELVEARGFAWTGRFPHLDVMIAIDLSRSTLVASGSDVDGDGRVGRIQPDGYRFFPRISSGVAGLITPRYAPRLLSTDLEDTVARAELVAARRFVESLSRARTRVGILTFAEKPKVRVGLGEGHDAALAEIARLERLERRRARDFGGAGTDLGMALAHAGAALLDDAWPQARREVVLLTDGIASHPVEKRARFAAAVAWDLSERGIGVHFVPIGAVALHNAPFFEYVSGLTGDSYTAVPRAGEIVEKLARIRLDRLHEVTIVNLRSGAPARDLRVFADGSFDALVELVPGANEIEFRAIDAEGRCARAVVRLRFDDAPPRTLAAARARGEALEWLAERLEARAAESALIEEIDAARARARDVERRLSVEVEPVSGGPQRAQGGRGAGRAGQSAGE